MVLIDERILEILETDGGRTPKKLFEDDRLWVSKTQINNRLRKLLPAGFVQKGVIGYGVYTITEQGRDYLAGEFDASEIDDPLR